MAGRSRGRNIGSRYHYENPRNNEHDDRVPRPSTSRGGGRFTDRHNFNKKVTFKANNRGGNQFRKSWENKTELVNEYINEFSNRNGSRNNSGRRSYPDKNHSRGGGNSNFRNSPWTFKESSTGWYSVFVPNVDDSDEALKIIQTYITPIVFYPYNKQFFDNALRFLVDDFKVAKVLHNTSHKITLRNERKLIIKVTSYLPPRGPISFTPVSNEVREKMIMAMAARYNPSTKSLDLSKFYGCLLFTENQLFVPLNRPAVLLAALNMVAQHTKHDLYGLSLENNHIYLGEGLIWIRRLFPELKVLDLAGNKLADLKELKSLSGFTIEVLNLSRNPVCDTEDKERYKRDVQQLFPMLTKLDNQELPSQYSAIVGSKLKMPINLGNSYPIPEGQNPEEPNPVMTLVESFLTQFYERYDNNISKQMVAEAYHTDATFSLSSCFLSNHTKGSLSQYLPESRNFLKSDRNKNGKYRYLHKGKENVVNFLDKLPKTKHDLGSFIVDVPLANAAMVQIVVNGVFVENYKENNIRQVYRSFSRSFCIVPVESGWRILSDMLYVTVVSDELLLESSKRFYKPRPIKKNNASNSNNATMFMEDTDEMSGLELSSPSSYQQPNYTPPSYQQQPTYTSYPTNPPSYQEGLQKSIMQNQQTLQQQNQPAEVAASFHSQQSFPTFNTTPTPTAFPTSSTPAHMPACQLSNEVSLNAISDVNDNSNNNLTMVKSFSNESGMNYIWAKKCLEENGWDYAKAALSFSKLKPNIPPAAFIH